jgi:hypothetical protein
MAQRGPLCPIIPYPPNRRNSHTRSEGGGRLWGGKFGAWNEGSDVSFQLGGLEREAQSSLDFHALTVSFFYIVFGIGFG